MPKFSKLRRRKSRSNQYKKKSKSPKRIRRQKKSLKKLKKSVSGKEQKNIETGHVSGYFQTISCVNNVCKEYKQNLNSFNDFNKLFHNKFIF